MREILRKLKLVEYLTTELNIDKNEFVRNFREQVDHGDVGFMSGAFDVFSSSKNEYKGYVGPDYFKIKRRRRFFDTSMNVALAKGTYEQKEGSLLITTEVNGFSMMMIPFYLFALFFYLIFLVSFLFSDGWMGNDTVFIVPFMLIHAAFMLGMPYFMMRRSTKRLAYELEREFFYMTKNKPLQGN